MEQKNRARGIRTHDPLVPNQMRYQTALSPELFANIQHILRFLASFFAFFGAFFIFLPKKACIAAPMGHYLVLNLIAIKLHLKK